MPRKSKIWTALVLLAMSAAVGSATPPLTIIEDTLYRADGGRFDGIAEIQWNSFQAADGSEVPRQTLTVRIIAGNLRVGLVPTSNALQAAYYTVKLTSDGRASVTEYWSVPPSGAP